MARIRGASFQGGCYLYIDWTLTSQNVSSNTSVVNYTFGIHFGDYYFNATNKLVSFSANPGSASHSWSESGTRAWPHGGTNRDYIYHSGAFTVTHAVDGRATVSASGRFNPSSAGGGGTRTVSGSFALPTIPRISNPPTLTLSNVTSTSVFVTMHDGGGGAPITSRTIAYGTSPTSVHSYIASDGTTTISGLTPGTTYYFWGYTTNSAGNTSLGPRVSATTLRTPSPPAAPTITSITMTSVVVNFTPPNNGGSAITGYQVGYSTSSTGPSTTVSGNSPRSITGLQPGTTYYFWVRAQNSVGLGPWSAATTAQTVAGVMVKVGTEWKIAVPYVRVGGVWVIAQPWVRVAGVWKESG